MDTTEFIYKSRHVPVVDVRTPAEYLHGHIPGAVNMPLFTNEERAVIGTLYLKKSPQEAMIKGMELVGPKMKEFAEQGLHLAKGGEVLIHCWRGGMRSNSMAWLFQTIGIKASALQGGYKAYRQFVHQYFDKPFKMVIIGGMTGSGKTEVLEELEKAGQQVIHLETLASHKGSVFGSIGMPEQPTTEQFENELFNQLNNLDEDKTFFTEDESIAIGSVFIPHNFFDRMSVSPIIILNTPKETRVERLVKDYVGENSDILIQNTRHISKHLGYQNSEAIIECIKAGDFNKAVDMILIYYDKLYTRSMSLRKRTKTVEIPFSNNSIEPTVQQIINLTLKIWQQTI